MAKTLLYRLFGVGKMPAQWRATVESEGVMVFDEGVPGSVTYRNFRAPGKRFTWRKIGFSGSIALTKSRLVALHYGSPAINVPRSDERFGKLQFSVEGDETFLVVFDPSLFHSDWSGTIEYRYRTAEAPALFQALMQR